MTVQEYKKKLMGYLQDMCDDYIKVKEYASIVEQNCLEEKPYNHDKCMSAICDKYTCASKIKVLEDIMREIHLGNIERMNL